MQLTHNRSRTDDGFTIIELLISIVILGVIMVPLSNTIITFFRNSDSSNARMMASHSSQMAAAYFTQDMETVGIHDYTAPGAPMRQSILSAGDAGATCGTSGAGALVRFLSDSYDTVVNPAVLRSTVVAWSVVTVNGDSQLVRTRCVDGRVVSEVTIARSLTGTPTILCSSTCNAGSVPATASLGFTVAPPKATPYAVTLTGVRRQT